MVVNRLCEKLNGSIYVIQNLQFLKILTYEGVTDRGDCEGMLRQACRCVWDVFVTHFDLVFPLTVE